MLVNTFLNTSWLTFSSSNVNPCSASFNVLFAMKRALPSNSLPVLVKWIKLVRRSLLSAMRTTRCWRSILSIKRVMLGLSLKVALHSSCCVTPSFSHRKRRTVHCSGVISTPFWRKFRLSFRLMAADTLPFNMANINWISKLNCYIIELLFKQLCKYTILGGYNLFFTDKKYKKED